MARLPRRRPPAVGGRDGRPVRPAGRRPLHAAIDAGDTGYPVGTGYALAVRDYAAAHWDCHGLDPGRTAIVPDVMMGIAETLKLVTAPGDPVVVCAPAYPPFYAFTRSAGRTVIEAPLGADGRLDLDALDTSLAAARARSGRAALLLSNPHNPTGAAHTRAELQAVAAAAARPGPRHLRRDPRPPGAPRSAVHPVSERRRRR
jgi:cysteine-S-conjugate beta-lyase